MRYFVLLILLVILSGCAVEEVMHENKTNESTLDSEEQHSKPVEKETQPDVYDLRKVEIREYEGNKLHSIVDVRDLSIKGPQHVDIDTYKLKITGLVETPKNYTYDEVLSHQKYRKVVWLHCVTGWSAEVLWEGILLKNLFDEVKVKPEANTVIFYAVDGYTTSLPLNYIIEKDILLADKINNVTIPPERGFPFELVAEDKLGYKWIKWVEKIELSDNPDYKGYWEKRGYSNQADVE
jgi:DMSO/TMAO reductase YedYZ molybdopterin-dependent catalytic subunit